ncbi:MAG: Rieske (2Fe-2S) protein [Burkholderiaceae bacterium]
MSFPPSWHPVLAAKSLRAGDNVVPALVDDQPLALWRSADGVARVWEDRCPHRGVALSLGRVAGDHLACAYHGWQYAATDGRCIAIPAMPHQPVPGKVCVKTYAVRECQGLVWVDLAPAATCESSHAQETAKHGPACAHEVANHPPAPAPAQAAAATAAATITHCFLSTFCVDRPIARVDLSLADADFTQQSPYAWQGTLNGSAVRLYTLGASAQWSMLHLFSAQPADDAQRKRLFIAARSLRAAMETPQGL